MVDRIGAAILAIWAFLLISRLPELIQQSTGSALAVGPFRVIYPLVLVLLVLSGGVMRLTTSRVGIALFLLTVWLTFCVPFSLWRGGSARWLAARWLPNMLTYAAFAALALDLSQWRRVGKALGWSTPVIAVTVFLLGREDWMGRVSGGTGTLANANEMAALLLISLPFWIGSAQSSGVSILRRLIVFGSLPLCLYLVVRTGSRAGVLTMGLLFVMFVFRLKGAARMIAVAVMGVFILLVVVTIPDQLRSRMASFLAEDDDVQREAAMSASQSSQLRKVLLMKSLEGALTHPLLGVGPGLFSVYSGQEAEKTGEFYGWREAHNTYTQIASEGGLPSLALFLVALIGSFRAILQTYRAAGRRPDLIEVRRDIYTLLMSLTGISFFAAFDSIHHLPIMYMMLGLAVSLPRAAQPILSSPPPPAPPRAVPPWAMRPAGGFSPARTA